MRNLTMLVQWCYIAKCIKKILYRCTSTFLALKYCCGFVLKSLRYLYEVMRTNLSTDFWTFYNFWPQFSNNFGATPSNKNKNYLAHLIIGQSLLKKCWKQHQNRPINSDTKPAQSIPPRTNSVPASEHDKKTNTIFSHLQPAHIVRSPPNIAWW